MNDAELNRKLNNLIRLGTLAQLDHDTHQLRVQSGGLLTGWLPWPVEIGRNFKRWRPLRLGTQVVLACPGGDPAQALIIGMLYSDAIDAPSSDDAIDLIEFDDGAVIEHNADTNALRIHSAGDLIFSAAGDISHNAANISSTASGDIDQIASSAISQTAANISHSGAASAGLSAPSIPVVGQVAQSGGSLSSNGIDFGTHVHSDVAEGIDQSGGPVSA